MRPGDDRRAERLREIAPRGQRAQREKIRDLRNSWRTDPLLAFLNWDLPGMTDDASIEETVDLARYRPTGTIEAVEGLSHFAGVPAPPDSIYRVPAVGFVLGPFVFTHQLAIRVAQSIMTEAPRPRLRKAADFLSTMVFELLQRQGAGLDLESFVAPAHVLKVCRAAIVRLAELPAPPDPWAVRLRRCPECQTFFWNAHIRPDARPECSDACRKKLERRSPPR